MPMSLFSWSAELAMSAAMAPQQASQVIRAAAFETEARAKDLVPVDTGNLKNSISIGHPSGRDTQPGDLEVQVGPSAEYGAYVEYGTSRMGAQPYLTPAAEVVTQALQAKFGSQVGLQ